MEAKEREYIVEVEVHVITCIAVAAPDEATARRAALARDVKVPVSRVLRLDVMREGGQAADAVLTRRAGRRQEERDAR